MTVLPTQPTGHKQDHFVSWRDGDVLKMVYNTQNFKYYKGGVYNDIQTIWVQSITMEVVCISQSVKQYKEEFMGIWPILA